MPYKNASIRRRKARRAATTVELALCLPVLLVLFTGAMEIARCIMVRQALVEAAYAAARQISKSDGSEAAALELCQEVLDGQKVVAAEVRFSPPGAASAKAGTPVTVTVAARCSDNAWAFNRLFTDRLIEANVTMAKEGG